MELFTTWKYGGQQPNNADNLRLISQWWESLNDKEITWMQRLIPEIGGLSEVHWQRQRFDEEFIISRPQIRGTTLYWYKPGSPMERSTTVQKLELDNVKEVLYIYPQSQADLVIRVGCSEIHYQTINLQYPELQWDEQGVLLLRDAQQKIEVKVSFTSLQIQQFKEWL